MIREKYKTVVIDDDLDTLEFTVNLINKYFPSLNIVATYTDAEEALAEILVSNPDLILSDVDLPEINGIDLIKRIRSVYQPAVLFITGYDKFVLDALRVGAFDYIIKPISVQSMAESIQRLKESIQWHLKANQINHEERILINRNDKCVFLELKEINYLMAEGPYTHIYMDSGEKITCSKTLKYFEVLLTERGFVRPHRSYLLNLLNIKEIMKLPDGAGKIKFKFGNSVNIGVELKNEIIKIITEKQLKDIN